MPGEKMIITYSYLEKLSISMNRFFKFNLPATLTKRYSRNDFFKKLLDKEESMSNLVNSIIHKEKPNLINFDDKKEFSDEHKNSKIIYLEGEDVLSYTWNVKAVIKSCSPIGNIQVTSGHPVIIDYSLDAKQAIVSLETEKSKIPNADFVLLFENLDFLKPKLKLFKNPDNENDYTVDISFNPMHIACHKNSKNSSQIKKKKTLKLKMEKLFPIFSLKK